MKLFKAISQFFTDPQTSRQRAEYKYLSQSADLVDLENRQRRIQRGLVSFL